MKKTYSKPMIVFEDFSLSTSITANCDIRINNSSENVCAYITRTGNEVFTDKVTGCDYKAVDGSPADNYDSICYHIPTETTDLFNS